MRIIMSFTFLNQLPSPAEIKRDFPLSEELKQLKKERDAMISDVITGKDDRFLVIIGPCSADSEEPVCDYVSRLTKIAEDVKDRLIIMVTHNPELAEQYSTRIIRLLDGQITDDTDAYSEEQMEADIQEKEQKLSDAQTGKKKKKAKKKNHKRTIYTTKSYDSECGSGDWS